MTPWRDFPSPTELLNHVAIDILVLCFVPQSPHVHEFLQRSAESPRLCWETRAAEHVRESSIAILITVSTNADMCGSVPTVSDGGSASIPRNFEWPIKISSLIKTFRSVGKLPRDKSAISQRKLSDPTTPFHCRRSH